jgi:hypothetical protein
VPETLRGETVGGQRGGQAHRLRRVLAAVEAVHDDA